MSNKGWIDKGLIFKREIHQSSLKTCQQITIPPTNRVRTKSTKSNGVLWTRFGRIHVSSVSVATDCRQYLENVQENVDDVQIKTEGHCNILVRSILFSMPAHKKLDVVY